MYQDLDINGIARKIMLMKQNAEELRAEGAGFPALERNMVRILASLKMLEINIAEVAELNSGI
ncbi:MAG TPA: hypothetical protein VLP30_06030 [Desulfatirhabdiaceae bacterium]|nr:hypothetical protein [Desulfatirhabdiaceae bacterium]